MDGELRAILPQVCRTGVRVSTLLELAERCEQASGPGERLDAEIVAALNDALLKPYPPQTDFGPGQRWQFWSLDGKHFLGNEARPPFRVLPFTASLDAAMTLVVKDDRIELAGLNDSWTAMINPTPSGERGRWTGFAPTPALALCAAALRARAAA